MRVTHAGDLARSFGLTQAYTQNKTRLDILTQEAASGRKSDVAASVRGDTRGLAGIMTQLRRLDAFDGNTAEAGLRLAASQQALEGMAKLIEGRATAYASVPLTDPALGSVLTGADSNLEAALELMNTQSAGQFVFSGQRSDTPAVVGAAELMAEIDGVVAGLTTAAAVEAAVSGYFDGAAGAGGYLDTAMTGSAAPAGDLPVGSGETVRDRLTAADPAFRQLLKGLTLAALAAKGVPGQNLGERTKLLNASGHSLLAAEGELTRVRSNQGVLQERVERAEVRNAAERTALSIQHNGIVAADPYQTAIALTQAESQLEKLYAITARLSRLSLADRL